MNSLGMRYYLSHADADAQCVTEQSEQPLLGPDYMSRAGLAELVWVRRDLSMFVKRNKNQLHDYMTTGPARLM